MAVILFEFGFPSVGGFVQQLWFDQSDDGLIRRFGKQTELHFGVHLFHNFLSVVFRFHVVDCEVADVLLILHFRIYFFHIFVLLICASAADDVALLQSFAMINQIQFFQIFEVEVFHFGDAFLVFVFEVEDEAVHGLAKLGMRQSFQIFFLIVVLGNGEGDQVGLFDFEDLMQREERIQRF
jgi:hypothetical protein